MSIVIKHQLGIVTCKMRLPCSMSISLMSSVQMFSNITFLIDNTASLSIFKSRKTIVHEHDLSP